MKYHNEFIVALLSLSTHPDELDFEIDDLGKNSRYRMQIDAMSYNTGISTLQKNWMLGPSMINVNF